MPQPTNVKPARERILDAAAEVMRSVGLAHSTTKAIAREAGYSEAMLYKHFDDKQELFLAVLTERMPTVGPNGANPDDPTPAEGDLRRALERTVEQLLDFFVRSFPIAASVFSAPDLLAEHRAGVHSRGFGPHGPISIVLSQLVAEQSEGRVRQGADLKTAAQVLVGFAFHQGFLAAFSGADQVPDAPALAAAAVSLVLPALTER